MALIRPTLALVGLVALTGCADRGGGSACGAELAVEPGGTTTILSGDPLSQVVTGTAFLPGEGVLVSVETNVPEAGDEVADRGPEDFVIGDDGCDPFELPVVDGAAVGPTAVPLAADDDGSLFLWDADDHRIVTRDASGSWRTAVAVPPELVVYGPPDAAVAPDGSLYVQTDASVHRVMAGELELVAGTGEKLRDGRDPGPFPRPATSRALPGLTGIDVTAQGEVVVTTEFGVLAVDAAGTLRLVADDDTTAGQEGAIVGQQAGPAARSRLSGIVATPDGDLLVGDPGAERVLRLRDGRSSVLTDDARALLTGEALDPTGRLLLAFAAPGDLVLIGLAD